MESVLFKKKKKIKTVKYVMQHLAEIKSSFSIKNESSYNTKIQSSEGFIWLK